MVLSSVEPEKLLAENFNVRHVKLEKRQQGQEFRCRLCLALVLCGLRGIDYNFRLELEASFQSPHLGIPNSYVPHCFLCRSSGKISLLMLEMEANTQTSLNSSLFTPRLVILVLLFVAAGAASRAVFHARGGGQDSQPETGSYAARETTDRQASHSQTQGSYSGKLWTF